LTIPEKKLGERIDKIGFRQDAHERRIEVIEKSCQFNWIKFD